MTESGQVLIPRLEMADKLWKQAIGLLGRTHLPPDSALWLEPCNGIHTLGMRFPIDVIYLDADGRVLKLFPNVRPWRICWPVRGTHAVIELPAGTLTRLPLKPGMRLTAASEQKQKARRHENRG